MKKWKTPAFITRMTKKQKICAIFGAILLGLFLWWAVHTQLHLKLWYLMPSRDEYYIYIPTDLSPEQAENCSLTVKKQTGFGETEYHGEYWQEQSCFHVIVEDRGIYRILLEDPNAIDLDVYVEIGRDEIYCVPHYAG